MNLRATRKPRFWAGLFGGLLAAALGVGLFHFKAGGGLVRLSYDLPFALRSDMETHEAVIIYLDEESHEILKQPYHQPWDRALHAQLVDLLRSNHCRVVVFDIVFSNPNPERPAADAQFIQAVKNHGQVVVAAEYVFHEPTPGLVAQKPDLPFEALRRAVAGVGNAKLLYGPDFGVRQHFPNLINVGEYPQFPTLAWTAAVLAGSPVATRSPFVGVERWLNYYGPPGRLPHHSYHVATQPGALPPEVVSNKVVFVGGRVAAGFTGEGKDTFGTPYSLWGRGFAPGVEIHATAFLNLLRGDWLIRLPWSLEGLLLALIGLAAGYGLTRLQPLSALGVALAAGLVIAVCAHALVWWSRLWFAWMVPVAVQIPAALVWSVAFNTLQSYIERVSLQRSLALFVPERRIRQILRNPELLKPGAAEQDITVLLSDIENYSQVFERSAGQPDKLARLLNEYFEVSIEAIHQEGGAVINLIGDAVFALWNAPETQSDPQDRACRAVLLWQQRLGEFHRKYLAELSFRTRIGLHTGPACVGNFGSAKRILYTAIGDTVNVAARLEGLNKVLETDVLMTEDFKNRLQAPYVTRLVGHFIFKGLKRVIIVYELIGPAEVAETTLPWREAFTRGWNHFANRRFPAAQAEFTQAIALRQAAEKPLYAHGCAPEDGPSKYYLQIAIPKCLEHPPGPTWMGEIEMHTK